jgi:hypothetical protein
MKALSLWQPRAYLAGVVLGDGWCTRLTLGLRVADEDFARAFAAAILAEFSVQAVCRRDERGYWLVRTSNKTGRFSALLNFAPSSQDEKAAWLRGLFDSEGNATLSRAKVSANAWNRRVALFSTEPSTIARAARYLRDLGIETRLSTMKPSTGHKGKRTVWQLTVRHSKANFARFSALVGSSIARKAATLAAIPTTYQPDGHHARAQATSAANRRERSRRTVLPSVVARIHDRLQAGLPVTCRACLAIPGYWAARGHALHTELVAMAKGG